ncbi:MAG: ribonuclease H-like domain-containing protein [Treponema sp.]|nr:ribonuclease H-like domain-containing protein [Treponema sp.]MCL2237615.1 ribonuclease H-like domain-containing protein [Treponema sp.]
MSSLKDRLKRIKESNNTDVPKNFSGQGKEKKKDAPVLKGFYPCGFNVLKREVTVTVSLNMNKKLPPALPVFIPDLQDRDIPLIKDFLFFDLETTGLSGGAGTVAFLAAFGKFDQNKKLTITQYLLLDYPGENDFLENVIKELSQKNAVIVSYNGKCFDSQIIKTRCLMNRMKNPQYCHADLLHPSRRLWKNIINDCSQSSVETNILGLDRTGDIPGSLAPEIWFEFLKTGKTERLIGICDHNIKDITGLSTILTAMISIAEKPFETVNYKYDKERLAKFVYKYAYKQMKLGNCKEPLELINKGLNILEPDTIWHGKLQRRKIRLEKVIKE